MTTTTTTEPSDFTDEKEKTMQRIYPSLGAKAMLGALVIALLLPLAAVAHEPEYTMDFDRDRCTFATTGSNLYFPLWPGYALEFAGEELDDEGELVAIANTITTLPDTELVDGVLTRVVEEREREDGELVEVSRNFFAMCRETGDVWYFGEDVDDYEDGVIVGHEGAWRAGVDGAEPGILMPGNPLLGARHFQEIAPGVAEDLAEVISLDATVTVPAGTFDNLLYVEEGSGLSPLDHSEKWYAPGIGMVKDTPLELTGITPAACMPDDTTHCLSGGRFKVQAEWGDFDNHHGMATAIVPFDSSGDFWFFSPDNTELIVKVLDACHLDDFNSFFIFAAGTTNVEVTLTVTDTLTGQTREYGNDLGVPFAPILDTAGFLTCDATRPGDDA